MNEKLPLRHEQLPDELETQTVEDFARDVNALEEHFHTHQDSLVSEEAQKNIPSSEYVFDDAEKRRAAYAIETHLIKNSEEDLDAQHKKLKKDLGERNRRADKKYQKDFSTQSNLSSPVLASHGNPNDPTTWMLEPIENKIENAYLPEGQVERHPSLIIELHDITRKDYEIKRFLIKKLSEYRKRLEQSELDTLDGKTKVDLWNRKLYKADLECREGIMNELLLDGNVYAADLLDTLRKRGYQFFDLETFMHAFDSIRKYVETGDENAYNESEQLMDSSEEQDATRLDQQLNTPAAPEDTVPIPETPESATNTPIVKAEKIPIIKVPPLAPTHELAKDVEDTFAKHFSLDNKTLRETPGFQNLNEAQQRLVLERFSSLVRENIHARAVKGHLESIDAISRTPAPTRYGRLKRATIRGWHTTTRSYQIGKQEAELHEKWTNTEGGKETEKLRLLTELSQSVLEDNAFGVDAKGRINFGEGEEALMSASERLNTLIRTKPEIGEKGAQERLAYLNQTIALGIHDLRSSFPDAMTPEQEKTFEHAAADWALRARKEVVLGTFMEKHRDLEGILQNNEASRGFARTTLAERGGIALAGFAGRGVLGTMCGFLAAPIVGAGIGGFMGWRRKGIEQGDADLLARMGEKIPSSETPKTKSGISPAHLTLLRKGVAERLAAAKTKKNNEAEIRMLSRRLVGYDTQLRSHESPQPAATTTPEGSFGFDNGKILNEKLLRLSKEYAQAVEDLRSLSVLGSDLDSLEAQRIKTEKLADRLAARTDYTQKRIMQQRVDIGGSPSARAGMLADLAAAIGTAETTLSMNDRAQQTKLQAHLNDVSTVLADRDKNVDKARLHDKKKAALEGAAMGAGFAFAGAALRDIFSSDSAIAAKFGSMLPASEKTPIPTIPETPRVAAASVAEQHAVTKTVVGGSGGFQTTPQEWHKEPAPPAAPSEFTNRMHAMEEALRQKPVPRPTHYDQPRFRADYHSPRTPRHFPEAWARGTEALDRNHRADVARFFNAPSAANPLTLEGVTSIPHETPADAVKVIAFYEQATEGRSAAFAQHIREEYTLKARLALKFPDHIAEIARMDPPVDDATMQSLVKMTKGAYLNGKTNPFMYAQSGIVDTPRYPQATTRLAADLDRMRVAFHRDANGRITGYDVNR